MAHVEAFPGRRCINGRHDFGTIQSAGEQGGISLALASIDIVIPVLNEEQCVRRSVTTLASRLAAECPYDWSVTVADNGSVDGTWSIVQALAAEDQNIRAIRLDERGRGRALKLAWTTSTADVLAYMDVDLSTGLESLRNLVDPLIEGQADMAIGSRLARGAQIERGVRREVISRIYNAVARVAFRYKVRDAQCGFKALRRDIAQNLLPEVVDDGWFFDTELIVRACRQGLRINEVPVRWVEDDDSRVDIVRTAVDDLKGIWRLLRCERKQKRQGGSKPSSGVVVQVHVSRLSDHSPMWDFDEHADEYVDVVDRSVAFTGRNSAFYACRKVEVLKSLAEYSIGDLRSSSVLDVGCGTGTTDRYLVDHVGGLTGIDVSAEMLAVAQTTVPGAEFRWYNGEKLPFPDESFDASIAICSLHHVEGSQRARFVSEMCRVTRRNGLIAIFEHNPLNPLTRYAVNSCDLDDGVVLAKSSQVATMLQQAGAQNIRRRDLLFTPLGGALGDKVDRMFCRLPFGGQYVVSALRGPS